MQNLIKLQKLFKEDFIYKIIGECPNIDNIYIVGGCIRDVLLDHPIKDIDLAIKQDAKKFAIDYARKIKAALIVLDIERDYFRIIKHTQKQIYQIDIAKFQGINLEEDLKSRDFTINALAIPLSAIFDEQLISEKDIIDYSNGLKDLRDGILRLPNSYSLQNDPLRMVRAFRFQGLLGYFDIDKDIIDFIKNGRILLSKVAGERIYEELIKILQLPNSLSVFKKMYHCALLGEIISDLTLSEFSSPSSLPSIKQWYILEQIEEIENIMNNIPKFFITSENCIEELKNYLQEPLTEVHHRNEILKLAALYKLDNPSYKISQNINQLTKRLKFSRKEKTFLTYLLKNQLEADKLYDNEDSFRSWYRFFHKMQDNGLGILLLNYFSKEMEKQDSIKNEFLQILNWYFNTYIMIISKPALLNGNDLMKYFSLREGAFLGKLLEYIKEETVLGNLNTPEEAIKWVEKYLLSNNR